MSWLAALRHAAGRFRARAAEQGVAEASRLALVHAAGYGDRLNVTPLERADRTVLFATDEAEIRAREKQEMRASSLLFDASQVDATYPHVFEHGGRQLRYAFLPAERRSRGLVVLFHGHNAFLHLGPMEAWRDFDVLAPWDTFGWRRQGSWFWGEKGTGFVAELVAALIRSQRERLGEPPWFTMGGSMGGLGALWHGIAGGCDGMYVVCPQVDLRQKVADYEAESRDNPYGFLQGDEGLDTVPDLLGLAAGAADLPPLFLIQYQYDPVNYFATHAFRLLDVYNRQRGWYGVRVYPAIGHGGDGSQREAEAFFGLVLDRRPPRRAPFDAAARAPDAPIRA